ncbi:MAG: RNA chaperone Hfq [Bacillota bacterium]|nr:RNA chaperone Hfq [Bacillota bacterium]
MQNTQRSERSHGRDMKIQDAFLNHCRREKIPVMIQLMDQSRKNGQIIGFDNQSIILDDNGNQHLIYKSAIIAINPHEPVNYIFNDAYKGNPLKPYPEYPTDFA